MKNRSAWQYFTAGNSREIVKKQYPNVDSNEVIRILGRQWRSLNELERAPFQVLADADKVRWEREMASYTPPPPPQQSFEVPVGVPSFGDGVMPLMFRDL